MTTEFAKMEAQHARNMAKLEAENYYEIGDLKSVYAPTSDPVFLPNTGWKRCPAPWSTLYTNYNGQIRGAKGYVLKLHTNNAGYMLVNAPDDTGHRTSTTAHRLVALAWIANPQHLSDVDHIDNDRTNNVVSNLRWLSHQDNLHGRNTSTSQGRPVAVHEVATGNLVGQFTSVKQASEETGVSSSTIRGICTHTYSLPSAQGYTFAYLDGYSK